jgi:ketosteroid isomerase-like protein
MAQQTAAHPNVKVVEEMYNCFARGDMESLKREVFAQNLVWHLPGRHPLAGDKKSPDEVIAFFGQLIKSNITVDLVSIDGTDTAVYEVHRGYTPKDRPGVGLDALNCTVYQIRDGKIAEVQVFLSDQHAADNFFNANYQLKPIPDRLASQ